MRPRIKERFTRKVVGLILTGGLVVCPWAGAETGVINRVGALFDDVAQGIDLLGAKAQDLFGPGLGFGNTDSGGFRESRKLEQKRPVSEACEISITNEFGEIRVNTWDNKVVSVTATISARAESADLAHEICEAIDVAITPEDTQTAQAPPADQLEIRTVLPDTRGKKGKPTMGVDYEITIPRDAHLMTRNDFGDTLVSGVGGTLALDTRYGMVNLENISGPVDARARGEFPLYAHNLLQGGKFQLYGSRAEFSAVSGTLHVTNSWGTVSVRELGPELTLEAATESGVLYVEVPEIPPPEIEATILFGNIESDIPLDQKVSQGSLTIARKLNPESKQKISLRSSFGDVAIRYPSLSETAPTANLLTDEPFKEVVTNTQIVPENATLTIEALPGDIQVIGADENAIEITATKRVRVQSQSNARAALQALNVSFDTSENDATLRTAALDNMAALGCTAYHVDLAIKCPRTLNLKIHAQDGHTTVSDTGGTVFIDQATGTVALEHVKGMLDLTNQKGDVQVQSCAGPVTVSTAYGTTTLADVYGKMTVTALYGKTVIEAPHAEISARSTSGDVKILSLDKVEGNFEVSAENGNISILIPPTTDAAINVSAEKGNVYSAIPMPGNIRKDFMEFNKVGSGPYRISLITKEGDILIN